MTVVYVRKPEAGLDRHARKVISRRLTDYFQSLTTELNKDAEAFFDRVMELAEERGSGEQAGGLHRH